jgi:sugar lactone lactonase YvrE
MCRFVPPATAPWLLVLLAACASAPVTPAPVDPVRPGTTSSPFDGLEDTGEPRPPDTAHTDPPEVPAFDCVNLPALPTTWTELTHIRASEEFAFDDAGFLVNVADVNGSLLITPRNGPPELLTTYSGADLAGIAVLPSGGVALCDEGGGVVMRIERDGSRGPLLTSVTSPNSTTVGPNGHVYVTDYDKIWEIDPVTEEAWELIRLPGRDLDGLALSPTYDTLYFNHDSGGTIAAIDLLGPGQITNSRVITSLQAGGELDGATVDICGNLYVAVTNGRIYRIFPDGSSELFLTLGGWYNTTSVHFGSGVGGWLHDHLYLMNRAGSLFEIPVGIPGRPEPHYPPVP